MKSRSLREYMREVYENNFKIGSSITNINEFTYEVDKYTDESSLIFLSEWFFDEKIHDYTTFRENSLKSDPIIPIQYTFPDINEKLNVAIKEFHIKEGLPKNSFVIFNTEGSTPMITSVILLARQLKFNKIISIFPLYFNIHKLCDILDIDIKPLNKDLTYEAGYELSLPDKKSFLFITDPIWIIGRHHAPEIFQQLSEWQKKTGSLIFVDGSFSYMDWNKPTKKEQAMMLDPDLTLRLVCPTKALCLHGLRFSYLICPNEFSQEIARISCSNIGSSCYFSHIQRERLFYEMTKEEPNPVGLFSFDRYNLLERKLIDNDIRYIKPNCGFFMYAELEPILNKKGIRDRYLWLNNISLDIPNKTYESYAKINLISREKTFNTLLEDLSKI